MTLTHTLKHIIVCLIILSLTTLSYSGNAQTFCPPNIDFEDSSFNNWQLFTGTCCPVSTNNAGFSPTQHAITYGNSVDFFGGFPTVAPAAGKYSLKLGNSATGSKAERARYYVRVPNGQNKYILVYRYAVVFEDPGHHYLQQPSFQVDAYDSATNTPLPCNHFKYVASSSIPGFTESPKRNKVFYLPWTTGTIDLSDYPGQTIAIDFTSSDCGLSGHFGYGYVDVLCGLFKIQAVVCDSAKDITLNGPPGYQSYEWRDSALSNILSNNQILKTAIPSQPTSFAVILTPYPGFGCKDTLYTRYTGYIHSSLKTSVSNDTTVCPGSSVNMFANVITQDSPIVYTWTPSTSLSCINCPNPSFTATSTTNYQIISANSYGCADTNNILVTVDTIVRANIIASTDSVCGNDSVLLQNIASNPFNTTISWVSLGAGSVPVGSINSNSVIVSWTSPGLKTIVFEAKQALCTARDTLLLFVKPDFSISFPPDDTICLGESKTINLTQNSSSPLTYSWTPSTSLSCSTCMTPVATPNIKTTYKVVVSNSYGCADSGSITVSVDSATFASFELEADTICIEEEVWAKNSGGNPLLTKYLWATDTAANITYGKGTDSIRLIWKDPGLKSITHTTSYGICTNKDTQTLYVAQIPSAGFDIPSNICLNEPVTMTVVANEGAYKWKLDDATIADEQYVEKYTLSWKNIGPIKIKLVVSLAHCIDSFEKEVNVRAFPIAKITADEGQLCLGKKFSLHASKGLRYQYDWSPAILFDENDQPDVTGTVERTEYVYLNVRNQWQCERTDSILISGNSCCNLFIPNVFTPNNDGKNDYFRPIDINKHELVRFVIVDRWGQVVYDTEVPDKGWDGLFKGSKARGGTYYYQIKYICNEGDVINKKGSVILLR